jgi:hypothetical protein
LQYCGDTVPDIVAIPTVEESDEDPEPDELHLHQRSRLVQVQQVLLVRMHQLPLSGMPRKNGNTEVPSVVTPKMLPVYTQDSCTGNVALVFGNIAG